MYNEYQPSPLLSPYIDKYWVFKGKPEYGMRIHILPDGCVDFIFTLDEVANSAKEGDLVMQPYRSYFVGPMTKYLELVTYSETVYMLGVRFLPCGLFRFMNLPLHELVNWRISTTDLPSIFDDSFAEKLCEKKSLRDRIVLLEDYLFQLLKREDRVDRQIAYAVHSINSAYGNLSIPFLANEVCLSQRHLERKFKMNTGFTPKEYSRIVKFRHAIGLLKSASEDSLLSTAVEAGYYDASHLSKEIKTLSGQPPSAFFSSSSVDDVTQTYIDS